MARKTPTKKQRLSKQYKSQLRRIEKNYRDIERMGGSFSQSLADITRPVKTPTEATIRRLKSISKNDLYRLARTETGQSGWKLKLEREERARSTRYLNKVGKEYAFEYNPYLERYWKDYTRRKKQYEIKKAWDRKLEETEEWRERAEAQWDSEPEPQVVIPTPEEHEPEPHLTFARETAGDEAYFSALEDHIDNLLSENQDSTFMRALRQEFDEMRERLSKEEFNKWLDEHQEEFIKTIEEVVKYEPKAYHTGEGLNKFTKAMNMLNDGMTPLDKYYTEDQYYDELENEEDEEESDDEYFDVLDTVSGEVLKARHETYLQRVDKWGHSHYSTRLADENGLTLDDQHYIPISNIKDIEDYLK